MKKGPTITAAFTIFALVAVVAAFMSNASPYVTFSEAKKSSGTDFHVAGDVLKNTLSNDLRAHILSFKLRDQNGDIVMVRHTGEVPAELANVNKVVAIGGMKNGEFVSSRLLVKCPSKYEEDKKRVASNEGQ